MRVYKQEIRAYWLRRDMKDYPSLFQMFGLEYLIQRIESILEDRRYDNYDE